MFVEGLEDRRLLATLYWLGTSGSNWNADNWTNASGGAVVSGLVPTSNDDLRFDTAQANFNNSFTSSNSIAGLTGLQLTINDASATGDFNIGGTAITTGAFGVSSTVSTGTGATLSFGTTGITLGAPQSFVSNSGLLTVSSAVANGGNLLTVTGTGNTTISGILSGAGGLIKSGLGAGTMTLSGVNTYTGVTTISGGTLRISSNNNLGTNSSITISNGSTLQFTNLVTLDIHRGITLGTGGGVLQQSGSSVIYYGPIAGGGGLTKSGISDLILAGSNAPGALTVNAGRLFFNSQSNIGSSTLTVGDGGTLDYYGNSALTLNNSSVTLQSGATVATRSATLTLPSSTSLPTSGTLIVNRDDLPTTSLVIQAGVALSGTLTIQVGGSNANVGTATISGVISGNGGLTKTQVGTLALGGANTYSGATTISGGTLQAGAANTFSVNSAVTLANASGATLALNNLSNTIFSLAGGGASGGNVTLGSGTLTTGGTNATTTYSGVIIGTGGLSKVGTGTQTLSGTNTYTGATTINAGTLSVTGSTAAGSAVTANSGGTLAGTGTVKGTATIASGGTLAPGLSGPGVLNTGNLNVSGGYTVEIAGNIGAGNSNGHDQTNVTGTVTLGNASILTLNFAGLTVSELSANPTFVIINNDGSDAVNGTFSGLAEGSIVASNVAGSGRNLVISYVGGDGNDVALNMTTTTVSLSGTNLLIEDTDGADTNDNLTLSISGINLVISDPVNRIATSVPGATGNGTNTVTVPLSAFSGDVIVNTFAGNDVVNVSALGSSLPGGLVIDGGTGFDTLNFNGNVSLASGAALTGASDTINVNSNLSTSGTVAVSLIADRNIQMNSGSRITTTDGAITLRANQGAIAASGNFAGILVNNADISSTTGDILLQGRGGDTDWNNRGVWLVTARVSTVAGDILFDGHGGASGSNWSLFGVQITSNSVVKSTGSGGSAGSITINGTGEAGGTIDGVVGTWIDGASRVTSVDGDITITGQGGDGNFGNIGTVIKDSGTVVQSTGTNKNNAARITINGTGGGASYNSGIEVNGATVKSVAGDIVLEGTGGGQLGTGYNNNGVSVWGARIESTGTDKDDAAKIIVTGTGGTGSYTNGLNVAGSTITSVAGDIALDGTGGWDGTGIVNSGIAFSGGGRVESTGTNKGDAATITLSGTGGAGSSWERGIEMSNATIASVAGDITLEGTGGGNGTGEGNLGLGIWGGSLIQSTGSNPTDAANITFNGIGGTGTSYMDGVDLNGAQVLTNAGNIALTGQGGSGTGGLNRGIIVQYGATVTTASGDVEFTGTALSGGTWGLMGVQIVSAVVSSTSGGDITIDGTGGAGSGDVNYGVELNNSARVETSLGGEIEITGVAGQGNQWINGIVIQGNSRVLSQDGDIRIDGETNGGPFSAQGIVVSGGFVTASRVGNISFRGRGGPVGAADGIAVYSSFVTTNGGDISLDGSSSSSGIGVYVNAPSAVSSNGGDINVLAGTAGATAAQVTSLNAGSGDVKVTALSGVIREDHAGTDITGANVTLNGELAPAGVLSSGQFIVDGDVALSAGDQLTVELNGPTAGTDYDQVQILGPGKVIDLGGANLDVSLGFAPSAGDEFVIVDNVDATSSVVGTFAGLPDGAAITVGTTVFHIYYHAGTDDNDVVLIVNRGPSVPSDVENAVNEVDEGAATGTEVGVKASSSDPDGDTLTYSLINDGGGRFAINSSTGVVTVANGSLLDGPDTRTIVVQASDGLGGTSQQSFGIQINNVAPTAVDDSIATNEDQSVTVNVVSNDTDPAGVLDPLSVTHMNGTAVISGGSVTLGSGGTVTLNANGTLMYAPAAGFAGADSFLYTITDGDGGSATAKVNVQVRNLVDVGGRVFDDRNNDGLFNGSDVGISGVTIEVWDQAMTMLFGSTVTQPDGRYFLNTNLSAGTYKIVEVVNEGALGLLDGRETAGNLGGTVDNSQNSNTIGNMVVGAPGTTADAVDYLFAEIQPSQISGLVWADFNNDGEVNVSERAIPNALIALTGNDDRGNAVSRSATSDSDGVYAFADLRPSGAAGYRIQETQPAGIDDGKDSLGTVNGTPVGSAAVNDVFSGVVMTQPGSTAQNYNFGERPAAEGGVGVGKTATIGFWQNKNGQALIKALNGGSTATQLGNWLAATLPNMYASLAGKSNADVAAFYTTLFNRNSKTAAGGGPPKMDAQVMATTLAVYATNHSLAGTVASSYGFNVSANGLGARTFNVGSRGAAFGVANNTQVKIMDLLLAVNARSSGGVLYGVNETLLRTMANDVFSAINESGDI